MNEPTKKDLEVNALIEKIKNVLKTKCRIKDEKFIITVNSEPVYKMISMCYWFPTKRFFNLVALSSDNILKFNESEFFEHAKVEFGDPLPFGMIEKIAIQHELENGAFTSEAKAKKFSKDIQEKYQEVIIEHIKHYYQCDSVTIEADPFCVSKFVTVKDNIANVIMPLKKYKMLECDFRDDNVVNDYKEHFPSLDDYLIRIAMSWFDPNCKSSYTWLKGMSNAGKSLLNDGVLAECGILNSLSFCEYTSLIAGSPSGVNVNSFINCAAVFIDEYEQATKKDMGSQMTLSINVKNSAVVNVKRRMTIVSNREDISGLVTDHGVEQQYENRFDLMFLGGNITKRPLFMEMTQEPYKAALRFYCVNFINDVIEKMVKLGKVEAQKRAAIFNAKHHIKYGISKMFNSISSSFEEIAVDCCEWILNNLFNRKVRANLVVERINDNNKRYYVKSTKTVIYEYLLNRYGETDAKTYIKDYKEIEELMKKPGSDVKGTGRIKVKGRTIKCIEINDPNLFENDKELNNEYHERLNKEELGNEPLRLVEDRTGIPF